VCGDGGVWCLCDVEYFHSDDARVSPWILGSLKPIQMSNFDYDGYLASRAEFTTDEWIDLLIQSIGFNSEMFGRRAKLLQLVRLIPFVERNYNLVELGPKGTGKSHIYSEFSPHGMLISGGEVTVPKLFVNNANGRLGLVGYWDVVAFDEFAGKKKRTDKALVDILKNYMANKSFSRGVETLGAEASMVFVGNTSHTVPFMLKHSDLFDELPESYHDPAYLDRLHFYIPGWEIDTIRSEMFSDGYGFVVDYIAEVLKSMRNFDYSDRYQQHFTLGSDISTRDRDGIHKTFSGLMKLIYPHGEATGDQIEELLRLAIEGRKRVKDQILRIDSTTAEVKFGYSDIADVWHAVSTLEEDEYPKYYHGRSAKGAGDVATNEQSDPRQAPEEPTKVAPPAEPTVIEGHREFQENQRGVSYDTMLLPYLRGATEMTIVDPYIRLPHQGRNLVDLLALIAAAKDPADEISVTLVTKEDPGEFQRQHLLMMNEIQDGAAAVGIKFTVVWDETIHDRSIRADNGWKILLGRGLDIFQKGSGSQFDLGARRQEFRQVVAFGVTYIREEAERV
jgi:ATP-dependent Lon protease